MTIKVKRVYDPPSPEDGRRVLVDRYWPRGLKKEGAALAEWLRDLAPSRDLIASFGHKPERWEEFKRRYFEELRGPLQESALAQLHDADRKGAVTLLFGARDVEHNNAVALTEYLRQGKGDRA